MEERDSLLSELEQLKETHEKYRTSINALKKNMKKLQRKVTTFKKPKFEEVSKKSSRIYKGRPSLLPVPENACDNFFQKQKKKQSKIKYVIFLLFQTNICFYCNYFSVSYHDADISSDSLIRISISIGTSLIGGEFSEKKNNKKIK